MIQLKRPHEIEGIRTSGKVLAECLLRLDEIIKEGVSTWDIDKFCYSFIKEHRGIPSCLGYCGYPNSACVSVNEVVIHGIPSKKKILNNGDIVSVDLCVTLDGYVSDSTRTYEVGNVSPEVHKLNVVTKKCLDLGIEAASKKGARILDVGSAVFKKAFTENGYGVVRDYAGHGVGFNIHEEPEVPNYVDKLLPNPRIKPGMVFAIEPMINMGTWRVKVLKDGWTVVTQDEKPACHWEHTVAMTDNGLEVLTLL
ncbi:type I methionyl aminopeptidase [Bullifex porci]|uniref:type I methionyl aminopeptidase n=1 Tax=Bullifex porci TaxID=2606638 RepID=UPI0023F2FE98|nr:type I methionyl aminopeptidase [Bullifex porci]MDD7588205.1 type I methionyl aminopeptidase [Bullifex porci]